MDMVGTYLFDLDGTLCDSRPGLLHAQRAAFVALGIETDIDPALFLGAPLPMVFRKLMPGVDEIDIAYGMRKFREAYEHNGLYQSPLYPGAAGLLAGLKAAGKGVWLATSKPKVYAEQILQHLQIADYFDGVAAAGLDEKDTKTTLIASVLQSCGHGPDQCLMLGDRAFDVIGALENGVTPVGALWGYGSRDELAEAGCAHFAKDIAEFRARFGLDTA
ncbi:MAG: HAD hydrolase-like protein [Rhizomicrobium sp.]